MNFYDYVQNSATNLYDPLGLCGVNAASTFQDCVKNLSNAGSIKAAFNLNPKNPVLKFLNDTFLGNTAGDAIQLGQDIGNSNLPNSFMETGQTIISNFGTDAAAGRIANLPDLVTTTTQSVFRLIETPIGRLSVASITRTTTTRPTMFKSLLGNTLRYGGAVLTGKAIADLALGGFAAYLCKADGY